MSKDEKKLFAGFILGSDLFDPLQTELKKAFNNLDPKCQSVMRLRMQLMRLRMQHGMTLDDAGDIHGVTRERIRQIEAKAVELMKCDCPTIWPIGKASN